MELETGRENLLKMYKMWLMWIINKEEKRNYWFCGALIIIILYKLFNAKLITKNMHQLIKLKFISIWILLPTM